MSLIGIPVALLAWFVWRIIRRSSSRDSRLVRQSQNARCQD
jgi:hypothetical protein